MTGDHRRDPAPLQLSEKTRPDGTAVLALCGEVDLSNVKELHRALTDAQATGDVIVDLTELAFIDSTGLDALQQAARRRGKFAITNAPAHVLRLLEITGLNQVIEVR